MAESPTGNGSAPFKVVLLGEGCVGKTSLVLRYVKDRFNEGHVETQQATFVEKIINIAGRRVLIEIWDTAGQERYHALGPIYYRGAKGAILVYDITDEDSFKKVRNWVHELQQEGSDISLLMVGNKIDCEKNRSVSHREAVAYAKEVGALHMLTSARLNKGVNEAFLSLAKDMLDTHDRKMARRSSMPRARNGLRLETEEEQQEQQRSGGCCS